MHFFVTFSHSRLLCCFVDTYLSINALLSESPFLLVTVTCCCFWNALLCIGNTKRWIYRENSFWNRCHQHTVSFPRLSQRHRSTNALKGPSATTKSSLVLNDLPPGLLLPFKAKSFISFVIFTYLCLSLTLSLSFMTLFGPLIPKDVCACIHFAPTCVRLQANRDSCAHTL